LIDALIENLAARMEPGDSAAVACRDPNPVDLFSIAQALGHLLSQLVQAISSDG
jgi:hypothetical protein